MELIDNINRLLGDGLKRALKPGARLKVAAPTPVGDYNPDWAIAFKEGVLKHVYFVAETKGSMSSMELRKIEETKIACARKFFDQLNR